MLELNKIYCGDCLELMKSIPDKSIDLVLADPPYWINISTWDGGINIMQFMIEIDRILKDTWFFVRFWQMPTMVEWLNESNKMFQYVEHINWVKRCGMPNKRLLKIFENFFIYSKGNKSFYEVKWEYTDVKLPGILTDVYTIESMSRYIWDMRKKLKDWVGSIRTLKWQHQNEYMRFNKLHNVLSNEEYNYCNVWSFLPENQANRNWEKSHPTQKPIKLMKRIVKMLTQQNYIVLDPFLWSWTTAIACKEMWRNFIGIEKEQKYVDIANKRLQNTPIWMF